MKTIQIITVALLACSFAYACELRPEERSGHSVVRKNIYVHDREYVGTYLHRRGIDLKQLTESKLVPTLERLETCIKNQNYQCGMDLYDRDSIQKKFFPDKKFSNPADFRKAWMAEIRSGTNLALPLLVLYRLKDELRLKRTHWRVFSGGYNTDDPELHPITICAEWKAGKRMKRESSSYYIVCFARKNSKAEFTIVDPSPFFYDDVDSHSWPYNQPKIMKALKN